LPGDRICLRLRAAHGVHLGTLWTVFRGVALEELGEAPGDPYITMTGKHYILSRAGAIGSGGLCFEVDASREKHLPGDYELQAVGAYPYELDGWEDLILEFECKGEISFRIAEEYGMSSPTVTG
jgi:hypothetical protein